MQSDRESEEIKNSDDKNIKKLREEFEKRKNNNENHPKTSHGYKNSFSHNSYSINSKSCKKTPKKYNKALSANKYNQKIYKSSNKLNDKISLEFYKKHPGYLYYKEIFASMKNNKLNKIRTLTGKVINRKIKLDPAPKNFKKSNNNKFNKNQKFPKIINGYGYNNNNKLNGKQKYYNNQNDKNNPYSYFWANKILNQIDFQIGVKGMAYGVPQLGTVYKKEELLNKVLNKPKNIDKEKENNINYLNKNSLKNNNSSIGKKLYYNNFIGNQNSKKEKITKNIFDENKNKKNNEKCYKIKNSDDDNESDMVNINDNINENNSENNKGKILEDNNDNKDDNNKKEENEFEEESFDEEQQKQFYQNQKNFFKARKDIMEEPEYLEEDNDIN